jgi:N-acetylmuramoyl-L-alanine amidase
MKIKYYLLFVSFCCMQAAAIAAQAAEMVAIRVDKSQESIVFEVPDARHRKIFLVPNPDRLVVDVASIPGHQKVGLPEHYSGHLIKGLRFGQFDPQTSRFVFDLNQPVRVVDSHTDGNRLVVNIAPGEEPAAHEDDAPAYPTQAPSGKGKNDATADKPAQSPFANASEPASNPPTQRRKDKKHAAAQSAHPPGKPMIVIDAGHGGVDPGTIGPDGTYEKELTLEYAKALKAKLLKSGKYQVKLTRSDDTFIMLRQRTVIARSDNASLFISLHADSAPDAVRGLSVYTVSEKASDKEAAALASRENKADVLAGVNLSDERDDVAGILISLAERDTMNRSAALADELVTSLDGKVRLLQNSHRFAGFAVLKAPDIPSVLIEIGFMSNEETLLKSKAYRDHVTNGIAAGVDEYFREQKRVGNL